MCGLQLRGEHRSTSRYVRCGCHLTHHDDIGMETATIRFLRSIIAVRGSLLSSVYRALHTDYSDPRFPSLYCMTLIILHFAIGHSAIPSLLD
jgi:hypothetical protein